MKAKILKVLALSLCLVMVLALAACNTATPGGAGTQTPGTQTPANTETPFTPDAPVELTFWHIWGSGDPTSAAAKKVIDDFNALDNNISIKVETYENDAYKDKIRVDVPGGTGPDVFSNWGGGEGKMYVDSGNVLALDDYLDAAAKGKMLGGALANTTYGGKVYGLTFGLAASGFYCNNRLFEENNVKIPDTYEELLTAIDAFKAAGITPMSTSFTEQWVVGMMVDCIMLKSVGAAGINNALTNGGDAFGDAGFLEGAKKVQEMVDRGAFNADAMAVSRDEAEVPVFLGEAAMYYMGSWAAGALNDPNNITNGDVGNFTYIPFPAISGGKGSATEFMGGASDCIMVNANTANPEAAAAFTKYFCENMAREGYLAGSYMPMWNIGQVDDSDVNPIMVSIKEKTASATDFVLWFDTFLGERAATYLDATTELLSKAITPEQYIEQLKTIPAAG